MKVILKEDIEDLGKQGEIKQVKDGFARNYLIPEGLAKKATPDRVEQLQEKKKKEQEEQEQELKELQDMVSRVDGQEVELKVKVGEQGQLYESVTAGKIQNALKDMGFEVKRKQINLEQPIEELGEFTVDLEFKHNLEAEIRVIVAEQ